MIKALNNFSWFPEDQIMNVNVTARIFNKRLHIFGTKCRYSYGMIAELKLFWKMCTKNMGVSLNEYADYNHHHPTYLMYPTYIIIDALHRILWKDLAKILTYSIYK